MLDTILWGLLGGVAIIIVVIVLMSLYTMWQDARKGGNGYD